MQAVDIEKKKFIGIRGVDLARIGHLDRLSGGRLNKIGSVGKPRVGCFTSMRARYLPASD